jgi:hypothetical protein
VPAAATPALLPGTDDRRPERDWGWLRRVASARLAAVGPKGAAPDPVAEVLTLSPPADAPGAWGRSLEDLLRRGRLLRERSGPPPADEGVPAALVFRRRAAVRCRLRNGEGA